MNRKQRRAQARHTRSAKSHRAQGAHNVGQHGWPRRDRSLDDTLSASADSDDHAEFRQELMPSLRSANPTEFLLRAAALLTVADDPRFDSCGSAGLVDRVADDDSAIGYALLVALSALAPTADDRAHAAALAQTRDTPDGMPTWLPELVNARAVKAIEYSDLWWDGSFHLIELDVAGHPLMVMLDVDNVAGFAARGTKVSDETLDDFIGASPEIVVEPGTNMQYVGLASAGRSFTYALGNAGCIPLKMGMEQELDVSKPLAAWAGRMAMQSSPSLPLDSQTPAGIAAHFNPDDEELDHVEVMQRFLGTGHGRRAQAELVDACLDELVTYALTVGHRRPLMWGPVRVADFLLRHIVENAWADVETLRTLPDLLRHWIAFINEHCEMPPNMAAETLERINECTSFYNALIESRATSLAEYATSLVKHQR